MIIGKEFRHVTNVTYIVFLLFFSACAPPTPQPEQVIVTAYATSASTPWLTDLYACAANSNTVLKISADSPDISLQIGEPENLISSAYQIGEEEILVVANRQSPLPDLTLEETQTLFAQGSPSAQVWVYPSGADMQKAFDQLVMQGRSVSSSAKITFSPQNLSEVLNSDPAAIGILPRQLMTGDVREVFSAGRVPVFAITKLEPQGVMIELISCLQNN